MLSRATTGIRLQHPPSASDSIIITPILARFILDVLRRYQTPNGIQNGRNGP